MTAPMLAMVGCALTLMILLSGFAGVQIGSADANSKHEARIVFWLVGASVGVGAMILWAIA